MATDISQQICKVSDEDAAAYGESPVHCSQRPHNVAAWRATLRRDLIWTLPEPGAALTAWHMAGPTGRLVFFKGTCGKATGLAAAQQRASAPVLELTNCQERDVKQETAHGR
jgi:hypothetical protein